MNYITEIKAFYDWLAGNPLPSSAIALWHALMAIANGTNWVNKISPPMSTLQSKSGLSKDSVIEARNKLKQCGRIDWKSRSGNQSAVYIITPFVSGTATQIPTQEPPQHPPQMPSQEPPQHPPINKLNEDKLNKKDIDMFFESIWGLYPLKKGKGQISDAKKRKLCDIGYEHLTRCIERYKASKPDWQAYQNGSTFFNSGYLDYLDDNYSALSDDNPKNGDRREDGRVYLDGKWVAV